MLTITRKGPQITKVQRPVIGCAYVGPNAHRNAETHEFWSVGMLLTDSEITIQKWMLKKIKSVNFALSSVYGEVKDYRYNPSLLARCLRKLYFWC